jgi:hypothetical protein
MLAAGNVSSNRGHGDTGEFGPDREGLTTGRTRLGDGVLVWASGENEGDLIMGGKKPLRLPRRFEPLFKPLSSSSQLMEIVGSVVETFVMLVSIVSESYPEGGALLGRKQGQLGGLTVCWAAVPRTARG